MKIKLKVCTLCKISKPLTEYNKNSRKKDGLQTACKTCNKIKSHEFYVNNKQIYRDRNKERRKLLLKFVYDYAKERGCIECDEKDPCCLDFDHVTDNKTKEISRMVMNGNSLSSIQEEIKKCEIRCSNCHRKKTAKQFDWYKNLGLLD